MKGSILRKRVITLTTKFSIALENEKRFCHQHAFLEDP